MFRDSYNNLGEMLHSEQAEKTEPWSHIAEFGERDCMQLSIRRNQILFDCPISKSLISYFGLTVYYSHEDTGT
jgi:hypothetical protein